MGMREYPCRGEIARLSDFYDLIPELQELIEESEPDPLEVEAWLKPRWNEDWPGLVSVLQVTDEITPGDGMSRDEWYVVLDEDQMYEIRPTDSLEKLQEAGVEPFNSCWSVFG